MKRIMPLLLLLCLVAIGGEVELCLGLTRELNELRFAARKERQAWLELQPVLELTVTAAQQEQTYAEALLQEAQKALEQKQASVTDILKKTAELRGELERQEAVIRQEEQALAQLRPRLPGLLVRNLDNVVETPETGVESLPGRLRRLYSAYQEISAFDCGVHVGREVVTGADGISREMQVMYLGTACGYALSPDGKTGGFGRPAAQGWNWQWKEEWAAVIRESIAVASKQKPAQLVTLPLEQKK